jgi:ribonucleoside-triphosphate reductase (formate)
LKVCKSDGSIVNFNKNKIIQTCMSAGADFKWAKQIAWEIRGEGYEGLSTDEIRMRVYLKLKKINSEIAERYVYRSNMRVRTSSNTLERFDLRIITDSLVHETKVNRSFAEKIAKEVEKELGRMRLNYVTAPLIREIVNVKLLEHGMECVRSRYTRLGMPIYDVKKLVEDGSKDIAQYSPEAVHKVMSDRIAIEYALMNILSFDISDAHMSGQIHIHDLNNFPLRPTTFSHDLRFFLRRGLKVDGTGEYTAVSSPAKKPTAAFMQALKVLIAGQTECSRGQYIEDFNIILAPYVEGLSDGDVKQLIQMLFYEISQTSVGKGGQAIYATLCVDSEVPKNLSEVDAILPGGKIHKGTTYADYHDEAEKISHMMLDVALESDALGKPFIYPRIVYSNFGKWDDELLSKVASLAGKYGTPYIFNAKRQFYGSRRGTIQHVSVNLPQISLSGKDIFPVIENRMKKAFEVLILKKKVMEKNIDRNMLPFLKQKALGLRYFNPSKQHYVISYSGLNELVRGCVGVGLDEREGFKLGLKVLRHMQDIVSGFSKESGLDFILTGDPKGICYTRFAMLDALRHPDKIISNGGERSYYSKTHYVNHESLWEKLDREAKLNSCVNGRTTTHIRLDERDYDPKDIGAFIKKAMSRKNISYLSLSRSFSICAKCGKISNPKTSKCVRCKSKSLSFWARDSGHLQNTKVWNTSQKQAFLDEYRYSLDGEGTKYKPKDLNVIFKR